MTRMTRIALLATMMLGCFGAPLPAGAAEVPPQQAITVPGSDVTARFVQLGMGKSVVIDLPRDVKDVLVADPKTANAVMHSTRRAYLIGVAVGQTNIFFFDAEGKQIAGFDVAVSRDLNGLRAILRQMLPHADIRVDGVGKEAVLLTGTVNTAAEAQLAYDTATRLLGQGTNPITGQGSHVVNGITIKGRDQVMLKVTVAEVQRDVIKQLGVDSVSSSLGYGSTVLNFNTNNPFTVSPQQLSDTTVSATWKSVNATLRAMERAGVVRTLAEPNLTAISGESANFLVGGEFPFPAGFTCDPTTRNCQVQVNFKKFGIGLAFTPVVLAEGRISLKVMTEVSELSNENSLSLTQAITSTQTTTLTIPSVKVRRAETTVEIPSGGALALAGMIQEQTKQQINGFPGLMQLPILGALFKSRDFQNRQTELMVIVTPYIVRAVARKDLSRPDDGFVDASDPATVLLGRLNRIYGVPTKRAEVPKGYHGKYGFILD